MVRFVEKYWIVLRVALVVSCIRLMLRIKRLPEVLDRLHPRSARRKPDDDVFRDLVYYLDRWLQLFPYNAKGNCFPRSLALYWFARRSGYPVSFRCGVRKEGAGLDGHAWLILDRQPFHEPGQHWQHFAVTYSFPPEHPVSREPVPPMRPRNGKTAAI